MGRREAGGQGTHDQKPEKLMSREDSKTATDPLYLAGVAWGQAVSGSESLSAVEMQQTSIECSALTHLSIVNAQWKLANSGAVLDVSRGQHGLLMQNSARAGIELPRNATTISRPKYGLLWGLHGI